MVFSVNLPQDYFLVEASSANNAHYTIRTLKEGISSVSAELTSIKVLRAHFVTIDAHP